MEKEIEKLLSLIREDYKHWTMACTKGGLLTDTNREMIEDFCDGLTVSKGNKYLKIVSRRSSQDSVWGFVVSTDKDEKFRKGDILKPAGWAAPARNFARGNVFDLKGGTVSGAAWERGFRWTGAY